MEDDLESGYNRQPLKRNENETAHFGTTELEVDTLRERLTEDTRPFNIFSKIRIITITYSTNV